MRYFIGRDGRQSGPYTESQVRDQLAARLIGPDDLVWSEGMAEWQPVRTRFGADNRSSPPPPPLPPPLPAAGSLGARKLASRENRLLATSIDHIFVIAFALPGLIRVSRAILQPMQAMMLQTDSPPDPSRIAGQLQPILIASIPLFAIPLAILALVQFALLCARGQTLGKLFCRIRVVRTNGAPAGTVHALLLRAVLMGFIAAIPVVGWLVSSVDPLFIFREDRRCLHDLLAGTTVVDV